jgi:hypothetical protein
VHDQEQQREQEKRDGARRESEEQPAQEAARSRALDEGGPPGFDPRGWRWRHTLGGLVGRTLWLLAHSARSLGVLLSPYSIVMASA